MKCGGPIEPATEPDDNVGKQPADALSIVEKAAALAEKYRSAFHVQPLWKAMKIMAVGLFPFDFTQDLRDHL